MNPDPLSIALQEIAETRRLLENLITSSESFDYPKAKVALRQLDRKVRELGKLQAEMQGEKAADPKIHVLDFSTGGTSYTSP